MSNMAENSNNRLGTLSINDHSSKSDLNTVDQIFGFTLKDQEEIPENINKQIRILINDHRLRPKNK